MTLLPVGQWQRNIEYFKLLSDEGLVARHKEATEIWFRLLMADDNKNYTSENLVTIAFWQHIIDCTESILKERKIII